MIIGVDFRLANTSCRGMARYCREIVSCLVEMDSDNNYLLFVDRDVREPIYCQNVTYIKIKKSNYILGEQIWLPIEADRQRCDILWCPNNSFPIFLSKRIKLLVTIHDVIFYYQSEGKLTLQQWIGKLYRKFVLQYFSNRIDGCFTVSNYSKAEIYKYLNLSCPIEITPNCIHKFSDTVQNFLENNEVSKDNYFFTLSGDAPSKNLSVLIDVFMREFPHEKLVIGGVSKDSDIRKYETPNIHFLPVGISDIDLIKTYLGSKCFLFCSKFEGFGIPIIEAVACNLPIISSNTTSLPEILDGNGLLVSPSYDGIYTGINYFLEHGRLEMSGYKRILNRYNDWKKSATIIYNRINQ